MTDKFNIDHKEKFKCSYCGSQTDVSFFDVAIEFSHRSVFPVVFSSGVVKKWWNGVLFFRLYCRCPGERMVRQLPCKSGFCFYPECFFFHLIFQPQLIGRASLPLRRILRASHFCLDTMLYIHRMNLQQAASEEYIDEDKIGTMKVYMYVYCVCEFYMIFERSVLNCCLHLKVLAKKEHLILHWIQHPVNLTWRIKTTEWIWNLDWG